jgi:hypothetical protein
MNLTRRHWLERQGLIVRSTPLTQPIVTCSPIEKLPARAALFAPRVHLVGPMAIRARSRPVTVPVAVKTVLGFAGTMAKCTRLRER